MRNVLTAWMVLALLLSITASAQNTNPGSGGMKKIEPLPRDLEIQLALSALPPHLRENATVYVLNPDKGFEVARKGTNEFYALVARTGDDTFRGSWPFTKYRDDILYPISFDEAGSKAQLRVSDASLIEAMRTGTPAFHLFATAIYTGLASSTLNKLRHFGGGPAFLKLGRRVLYDVADLDTWLAAHRRHSTADKRGNGE